MVSYPAHWEADVVLRDGRPCHLRPITPEDGGALSRFHAQLSPETIYYRFFAPYPELTERDVSRFTTVDYADRVAIVATVAGDIVGVGRYDRIDRLDAEVAFTIRDDHQGRGLGSILLEHLAAAARERGIRRFVAEVLPANRRMIATFEEAGYRVAQEFSDGVVRLQFEIEPTAEQRSVREAREHRSEARSVERLLAPRSVVVIGASRRPDSVGQALLRHVVEGGFTGPVYAVHPEVDELLGVPAYRSLDDVPRPVDLALVATPGDAVPEVVQACARARVVGMMVVTAGYAETGPEGMARQRELVELVRGSGMRIVGPNALGLLNTAPGVSLNASLAPAMPLRGRIGFFCQSGALGSAILRRVTTRGMGLSTFVSAGNRADVSGNDLMQYWEEDDATSLVLLYLESIGNPRKFARVARRLSLRKPIVAVRSGRTGQALPLGGWTRRSQLPPEAIDAMFRQSGVIQTDSLDQLLDVAGVLAFQPLPKGPRVAVVGNSDALAVLATDALAVSGLTCAGDPVILRFDAPPEELGRVLAGVVDDPAVDSVVVLHAPPLMVVDQEVRDVILAAARRAAKPVVAVLVDQEDVTSLIPVPGSDGIPTHGSVPSFADVEDAVRALAAIAGYARWLDTPRGELTEFGGIDPERARILVERTLAEADALPGGPPLRARRDTAAELLAAYGVSLWPCRSVATEDEAVAAAEELGYPVVLKTTAPGLVHRTDLGGVRLNIENERALRTTYLSMVAQLGAEVASRLVVQRMAPPGVACVVESTEDPLFGPVVAFGVGGVVTRLLGDRAYRNPPITDVDATTMVREPGASPLLRGYDSADPVDVAGLEDLLQRIGRLADDLPEVARLELNPVVAWARGVAVLEAELELAQPEVRTDQEVRRLTTG
ncbi:MAG: GNAT family N-acetyltransferase [Candidatus Nanopelagicales bacterium]